MNPRAVQIQSEPRVGEPSRVTHLRTTRDAIAGAEIAGELARKNSRVLEDGVIPNMKSVTA